MIKSYSYAADMPGQHVLILGAVHGDEIAGTIAQQEIIKEIQRGTLHLKSGRVTFIPTVNEAAQKADTRYIDINLNRVVQFHSTPKNNEEKIANQLISFINDCDIMLDLHSTHCPEDVEFAFIDHPTKKNMEMLSLIPVSTALAGWPQIYANNSDITNFCTEEYAYTHNKIGITVECGYHKSPHSVQIAKQSILNILAYYKILDYPQPTPKLPEIITLDSFFIKQHPGHLSANYQHLSPIKKDEILAIYEHGEKIHAPFSGFIIMPNHKAEINDEWFYLGRKSQ